MTNKIGLLEVKQALKDERFRLRLPQSLKDQVNKFLSNPGCACNVPLYKEILLDHSDLLREYYPGKEVKDLTKEVESLTKNNFSVINCHVAELESKLQKLGPGRKQIAVARFEDQVTAIVNELDFVY